MAATGAGAVVRYAGGSLRTSSSADDVKMARTRSQLAPTPLLRGRGLHSPTLQLKLSAVHGIGGARGGCVGRVEGVLGGV